MIPECAECHRNADQTTLIKCPVCHKYACPEHQALRSGRPFCSRQCAEYFFFSEEDED